MSYLVSGYIVPEYGTKTPPLWFWCVISQLNTQRKVSKASLDRKKSDSCWSTTFSRTLPKNGRFDMEIIKISGCKTSFAQTLFPVKGVNI